MTAVRRTLTVMAARGWQRMSWPGMVGLGLLTAACGLLGAEWKTSSGGPDPDSVAMIANGPAPTPDIERVSNFVALPGRGEIPLLLTELEWAAIRSGVDWRAADYKLLNGTPGQPASLELKLGLKSGYPKLRQMLVEQMRAVPSLAIRELRLTRANTDTVDVDAQLVLAVILDDGPPIDAPTVPSPSR